MIELERLKKITDGMNLKRIARDTDIKYMTLYWALKKTNANPRYYTIKKLSDYMEKKMNEVKE
jgi:DNA-binding phage protein